MRKLILIILLLPLGVMAQKAKCLTYEIWETYNDKTGLYERPYDKPMTVCIDTVKKTLVLSDPLKNIWKHEIKKIVKLSTSIVYELYDVAQKKDIKFTTYEDQGFYVGLMDGKTPHFRLLQQINKK